MTEYLPHRLANLFPMMLSDESLSLKEDIRSHGLREPIVIYQGQILDGRNRYLACLEIGIEPQTREFNGDDDAALTAVLSWNLERRHLSSSQKAAIAVELDALFKELEREAKQRQLATLKQNQATVTQIFGEREEKPESLPQSRHSRETTARAAAATGANREYYRDAKKLIDESPEIHQAVKAGAINIPQAKTVAALPVEDQAEVVAEITANPGIPAKEIIDKHRPHVVNNSGENEWYTPSNYIEAARRVLGEIDFDPASCATANETVRATDFITKEQDSLTKQWYGRVWLNPPYSGGLMPQFAEKYAASVENGDITSGIVLVNNATETKWFERLVSVSTAICFPTGRVQFIASDGLSKNSPLQGQAFLYYGDNPLLFIKEFAEFGWTCDV